MEVTGTFWKIWDIFDEFRKRPMFCGKICKKTRINCWKTSAKFQLGPISPTKKCSS